MQRFVLILFMLGIVGAGATLLTGQSSGQQPVNTLDSPDGAAIKGYDPVAYFTAGGPQKGKPEFSADYRGATWHFASAAHKALFEANPAKYAPEYGGYCAYGVAQGYLVKIEPDAWAIRDSKLYLNYDQAVQKNWSAKPVDYIDQADSKWPELISKK